MKTAVLSEFGERGRLARKRSRPAGGIPLCETHGGATGTVAIPLNQPMALRFAPAAANLQGLNFLVFVLQV